MSQPARTETPRANATVQRTRDGGGTDQVWFEAYAGTVWVQRYVVASGARTRVDTGGYMPTMDARALYVRLVADGYSPEW